MCNEVLQRKSTYGDKAHYLAVVTFYCMFTCVKAVLYIPLTIIITPVFPAFTRWYLWLSTKLVGSVIGLHAELEDGYKLKDAPKGIIVMNHQSFWDFFMVCSMYYHLGESVHTVSRKEVYYMWPLGYAMWLSGSLFIDRSSPATAMNHMISESRKLFAPSNPNKSRIIIFPEGTRNKKMNGFQQFKRGAFKVAATLNVPIIPIVCPPQTFKGHLEFFRPGRMQGNARTTYTYMFGVFLPSTFSGLNALCHGSGTYLSGNSIFPGRPSYLNAFRNSNFAANVVLKCLDPVMVDPERDLDAQIEMIKSTMLTEYHRMMDEAGVRSEDN